MLPNQKLDAKVIGYEKTKDILQSTGLMFFAIFFGVLTVRLEWHRWLFLVWIGLPLFSFLLSVSVIPYVKMRSIRYELHPLHLEMMTGMFFKKREAVPIERIQHVEVKEGPMSRKFGIQSVKISTAGTTHQIPLLLEKDAEALRKELILRIKAVNSDV